MANATATGRTHHGTLVAATADNVTFPLNYRWVTVVNRGTTDIFVRIDGVTAVGGADGTFAVAANTSAVLPNLLPPDEPAQGYGANTVVSLISSGTPAYSLEA
jgi:hypothetical protein